MAIEDRYRRQMSQLLPPGSAWARAADSVLQRLLDALAREFARVHRRFEGLVREADPRTASELLLDWERVLGLPDQCTPDDLTVAERREAAAGKLTEVGSQTPGYFEQIADNLGFDVTVVEYSPFVAGSVAGDSLTNGLWQFRWDIDAPGITVTSIFRAGSAAGDVLRTFSRESSLECEIRKRKPAHTVVQFNYS